MGIIGFTVCVDYAHLLAKAAWRWRDNLDAVFVITAPHDHDTREVCGKFSLSFLVTNVFYENGAVFNKGAALSKGVSVVRDDIRFKTDWLLFFDADIVPPKEFRDSLNSYLIDPEAIYGASRWHHPISPDPISELPLPHRRMPQNGPAGFFMACHCNDPHLPERGQPMFDTCWPHAGNYDTTFVNRWPQHKQHMLDLPMHHLGNERENWFGIGRQGELKEMLSRRKLPDDWQKERMAEL